MLLEMKKRIVESDELSDEEKVSYLEAIEDAIKTFSTMIMISSLRDIHLALARINEEEQQKVEKLINSNGGFDTMEKMAIDERRRLNEIAEKLGMDDRLIEDSRFSIWSSLWFLLGPLSMDSLGSIMDLSGEETAKGDGE